VLGDGEQVVGLVTDIVRDWKTAGCPAGRDGLLMRLAGTGSLLIPRAPLATERQDRGSRYEVAGTSAGGPRQILLCAR